MRTLRDLLRLPRRALGARLGTPVLPLVALARGEEPDLPLPVPEPSRLCEAIDLEFAVEQLEPLRFALQGLLSRLLARLEVRQLACGELGLGSRSRAAGATRDGSAWRRRRSTCAC